MILNIHDHNLQEQFVSIALDFVCSKADVCHLVGVFCSSRLEAIANSPCQISAFRMHHDKNQHKATPVWLLAPKIR